MTESEIVYRAPERHVHFDYVTNPFPFLKYKDGKTCVFWDVDDYPTSDGLNPLYMKDKIEKALRNQGYVGEISIQAYVDQNFYPKFRRRYWDSGIKLCPLAQGSQFAKAASMFVDVVLWAYDNTIQSNMIVLSKKTNNIDIDTANGLYDRGYGIILSTTRPGWYGPSETEACFLTSLFDGGTPSRSLLNNKRKREDIPFVSYPKFTVLAAPATNMETLFPKGNWRTSRETRVFLDLHSFDTIPKDPCKIAHHILSVLRKERLREVSFDVFGADDNEFTDDLVKEYMEARFHILPEKYRGAKDDNLFIDILFWGFNMHPEPANVLVISENPNFGQDRPGRKG